MDQDSCSLLFGIDGLVVDRVEIDDSGRKSVLCSTDPDLEGWCPSCGERSSSVKAWTFTRPRDIPCGGGDVDVVWFKKRWRCATVWCERGSFTDVLPQLPARARLTGRLRAAVADGASEVGRSIIGVAESFGVSWKTAHRAFAAHADEVLAGEFPPVTALGIDETRRGKGRWERQIDPDTGDVTRRWVDRFDTGLVDLSGDGGLFAQFNGRGSDTVIAWLEQQPQTWRDAIEFVVIDASAAYARAARIALPNAKVVVDRFHLVAIANRAITEYRRENAWTRRGRRGRKIDPEWRQRNRLLRASETLTVKERAAMFTAMRAADPTGGIEKCWTAKELLRQLLQQSGPRADRSRIWQMLTRFYQFCADSGVKQLIRLGWTINAWQQQILNGLFSGLSNGRTEGHNRIVKHVGRTAFGFRNPTNHRRRILFACTRQSRAHNRTQPG